MGRPGPATQPTAREARGKLQSSLSSNHVLRYIGSFTHHRRSDEKLLLPTAEARHC